MKVLTNKANFKLIRMVIIILLIFAFVPLNIEAKTKHIDHVKLESAFVLKDRSVIVNWKKIKCSGYKLYRGPNINDEVMTWLDDTDGTGKKTKEAKKAEKQLILIKNFTNSNTVSYRDYYPGSSEAYYIIGYNKYKQKQYYNSKSKKWVAKKPSIKQWKERKTRTVTKYKYSDGGHSYKNSIIATEAENKYLTGESTKKELEAEYSKKFTDVWYSKLRSSLQAKNTSNLSQQNTLILQNDFYQLSDAMKIYAIDKSGIFACRSKNSDTIYGMYYNTIGYYHLENPPRGGDAYTCLEDLYLNRACGVCATYAGYEKIYFNSLGITAWREQIPHYDFQHAWTVVKVSNSKGKILWIPFDYGIGPSVSLAGLTKKERELTNTEEKRYKVYLDGIPGAPNYKNFTNEDFN